MKLLCLNVRSGGGTRWNRILDFVESKCADIVVFTEWRRSESLEAVTWATSRGMQWIGACDGATRNGVFVATAPKFQSSSITPGAETAGTLLRVAFEGWTMLACYFPQGDAKARYFQSCSEVTKAVGAAPFLIVGDLNTGNQVVDRTPDGERYACADLFDRLSAGDGLVDLWRRTQGAGAREWSWMPKANGFRLDHAFGNHAFVAAFDPLCEYDHSPREAGGFSDHSAVVISAKARATAT
jgi:exonuclease III